MSGGETGVSKANRRIGEFHDVFVGSKLQRVLWKPGDTTQQTGGQRRDRPERTESPRNTNEAAGSHVCHTSWLLLSICPSVMNYLFTHGYRGSMRRKGERDLGERGGVEAIGCFSGLTLAR